MKKSEITRRRMSAANTPGSKQRQNLTDNSTPDKPGETIAVTIRLRTDQIEALKNIEGSRSYLIRQAVNFWLNATVNRD